MQTKPDSITLCMFPVMISPFLGCCELCTDGVNSFTASKALCRASCIDRVREVAGCGKGGGVCVTSSFSGSDVAARRCGELMNRNVALGFEAPCQSARRFPVVSITRQCHAAHTRACSGEPCEGELGGGGVPALLVSAQLWRPAAWAEQKTTLAVLTATAALAR